MKTAIPLYVNLYGLLHIGDKLVNTGNGWKYVPYWSGEIINTNHYSLRIKKLEQI